MKRNQYFVKYTLQAPLRMYVKARNDKGTQKVIVAFKNMNWLWIIYLRHILGFFDEKQNFQYWNEKKGPSNQNIKNVFKSMDDIT